METNSDQADSLEAEKIFIHDISSPLMIAAGWLERWARREPSIEQAEEFQKLTKQLDRIQSIVTNRRETLLKLQEMKVE